VQQASIGIDRRNLRGRCGGPRVRRRKLPTWDTTSRFGRLPRQGQASTVRSGHKGACLSIAKLPPSREGRRDERPTAGDQHDECESVRRAPGSRKVESILIAATALPFAGEAETGI